MLYIDDEPDNLLVFRTSFRRDFEVFTAGSAGEALQLLGQEHIPIVISDQRMPGMTGVQLFEKMIGQYPDHIRIILTGYADVEAIIASINQGNVYHYITKPWDKEELANIIRRAHEAYLLKAQNQRLIEQLEQSNKRLEYRVKERTEEVLDQNKQLREQQQELKEVNEQLQELSEMLQGQLDQRTAMLNESTKELDRKSTELEQQAKTLSAYTLQMVQKNKALEELRQKVRSNTKNSEGSVARKFHELSRLIDFSINLDRDWDQFRAVFEQVHQGFFQNLYEQYPGLTSGEQRLCALVKMGLGTKELASVLAISPDSVKTARYRLRKKFSLKQEDDLSLFILNFK